MKRAIYLNMVTPEEALQKTKDALFREDLIKTETTPSHQASGRVTSEPVYARYSSPTYHSAAMDGFAVIAEATFAAREGNPVRLVKGEQCVAVNTGNPLPEGMDAVLMIERVLQDHGDSIEIETAVFPWQHVRRIGEDIVATELLIPQNHELTPYDVGALLSAGIWEVETYEQIKLRVIPTGDEVLDFTKRPVPKPGQVVESNSQVMLALAKSWGCLATSIPPVPDAPDALSKAFEDALDSDSHVVVIGAGSSAGAKDFSTLTIEKFGEVLVHGIKVMPGKPSILGVARGKLIVGAPGYPVSTVVCFEELLKPLVDWLGRKHATPRHAVPVELTRKSPSKSGLKEIVRLAIGRVGKKYVATPLARGAGMITTLTRAQGVMEIPAQSEGVEQGKTMTAHLLAPPSALEQTLVIVGSHDNTLDLLANELMGLKSPIRLASTHVGSMGGLTAIKNGSTLIAGAHLFDPENNDYNFPFIQRHLPDCQITVVNLAIRQQGLIVAKGNPCNIKDITSLTNNDVRFINRQRGAGTRILLDHNLTTANISPDSVNGYDKEEFTHMAVAVNVLTGAADCGLGIYAAAKALDLDFVPLARERYDLVIAGSEPDERINVLLELINTQAFQENIRNLGGYETTLTGQIMKPGMGLGE